MSQFPARFPLKVILRNEPGLERQVLEMVHSHIPDLAESAAVGRPSGGGKYLALTITFIAESREQVEAIYADLHTLAGVITTL